MDGTIKSIESTWLRSRDGLVAGVCRGVATRLNIDPWMVRIVWLALTLAFGTGLLLYVILAICLPREDLLEQAYERKLLGVCARLSRSAGIEIGVVRTLAVLLGLASFGATVVGYVILYFVMPDDQVRNAGNSLV